MGEVDRHIKRGKVRGVRVVTTRPRNRSPGHQARRAYTSLTPIWRFAIVNQRVKLLAYVMVCRYSLRRDAFKGRRRELKAHLGLVSNLEDTDASMD